MKKCTLIGHNGWTDYISQYALRRHFIEDYDKVILFIDSQDKYAFVKSLYPEDNIEVCVPHTHSHYDGIHTCIRCHTLGSTDICPRLQTTIWFVGQNREYACKFIDYSKYEGFTNIKLNAFDNFPKWDTFYKNNSFLDSMYKYYNLDFLRLTQKYKLSLISEINDAFYKSLDIQEPYIVIHQNEEMKLRIPTTSQYRTIQLNGRSRYITDTILTLRNAKEIHCIDSVYFFLTLILHIQYNCFKDTEVFLYYRSIDSNGPYGAIKQFLPESWHIRSL
jgi:hypothetical protein